ncbi:MAG: MAPEG family protein [Neisseriaceae bacterium]|nr:MAPEG family protein [Neisseriaceae bacterium]
MPLYFLSVLIAACLPYIWAGVSKANKALPYDNHSPRTQLSKMNGYHQRASWAQMNAWEAFAPFAAAVVIAHIQQVHPFTINIFALIFLVARFAHGLFYIFDLATLRSMAWFIGFACVVGLFIVAA